MTILVVEDEPTIASFIEKGLKLEGFAIQTVTDGETALDMIESNDYDLVILDLMLPKMSGEEVITSVREQHITTPILVLTAKTMVDDKVTALDNGADDYLTKPFSFEELLARIRALTRRGVVLEPNVLKVGEIELNPATREVKRSGQLLTLTKKEYAIIELLMRNPDRVCTRNMIGEHVWGFEFDMMSNVIDVHIARLRRKVDKGFNPKLIRTIRDVGYRLQK
ncbi:MAG: response regulator transcription factor [bacterium]|nr:response regulator transcription factor [bacterium]